LLSGTPGLVCCSGGSGTCGPTHTPTVGPGASAGRPGPAAAAWASRGTYPRPYYADGRATPASCPSVGYDRCAGQHRLCRRWHSAGPSTPAAHWGCTAGGGVYVWLPRRGSTPLWGCNAKMPGGLLSNPQGLSVTAPQYWRGFQAGFLARSETAVISRAIFPHPSPVTLKVPDMWAVPPTTLALQRIRTAAGLLTEATAFTACHG
jgi:hypothetical protein